MGSLGKVFFNSSVEVWNADDTVCFRQMFPDGRCYDVDEEYFDDDAVSLNLDMESDGMTFIDAVQELPDEGLSQSGAIDFNCSLE